ncbi:cellulose synthase-like protein G3 [Typha angustifolia]|uniref:cellulose synthase-like protein G3 n=1 Tax=Typha angustifolia TaxID=59011 RepID=UPI003C2B04F2
MTLKSSRALHAIQADQNLPLYRTHMLFYSLAILALLYHHTASLLITSSTLLSFSLSITLFISDLILAFLWLCSQPFRWRPVRRLEFPDRLPDRKEWPALDVFVCTADPEKEPPMAVVSTALSLMGFDYPADRLSVYVSDDGGSEVTFLAFLEAAKFARYWLPFCREKSITARSPEVYFGSACDEDSKEMKMMYQAMKEKVETAMEKGCISEEEHQIFKKWKGFSRNNHPSVIQVLLESSRDKDINGKPLPNLIYVSREKRPTSPHHFKAGALNVLVRVSSILTNAPVMLTIDCDMYSNDPNSPVRALCYFLDPSIASKLAFVQFPQQFQGLNKNDIYGGELKRLFKVNARGMDGLQGPNYVGTNCFHSRRALCGSSGEFINGNGLINSERSIERAYEVAACDYEIGTKWGAKIGFLYGSLVEDYHTGYRLHCEGWHSVLCDPPEPAFLGDAPKNLHEGLSQCKRWIVGLYEVGLSQYSPLTFGIRRASLPIALSYAHYAFWGLWCVPITAYAIIPQLALIYQWPLFPKVSDPWFYLYAYLFFASYFQDLAEFVASNGTIQQWWSDQRMWMTRALASSLFGSIQFALKHLGVSAQGFNVTSKVMEDEQKKRYNKGVFDFGIASPFFLSLGAAAVLNLSSLVVGIARAATVGGVLDEMPVQLFLSGFAVANCLPVYEAMFLRSDGGKMPGSVTVLSLLLVGILLSICFYLVT